MVVVALLPQVLDQTCRVAGVGVGLAVTDLLPPVRATLTTATGGEEIVVQLVVAGRLSTIKNRHGCPLQAYHDRAICLIREDVPTQSVLLPAKVFSVVESASYLLPPASQVLVLVGVIRHTREAEHSLFIRAIRSRYFVERPGRR